MGYSRSFLFHHGFVACLSSKAICFNGIDLVRGLLELHLRLFRWQPSTYFQHKILQLLKFFLDSLKCHTTYCLHSLLWLSLLLGLLLHLLEFFPDWLLILIDFFFIMGVFKGCCVIFHQVLGYRLSRSVTTTDKPSLTSLFLLRISWL